MLSNAPVTAPTFSTANRELHADHHAFKTLAPDLSTSKGFVAHVPNRNKMRELVASEPVLVEQLRVSKSAFNLFIEPLSGTTTKGNGDDGDVAITEQH